MKNHLSQKDLNTIMDDIITIRSNPKFMVERFNIVLYSLKGFKKNESTVYFIEKFIEELEIMEPLPEMKHDNFLSMVAQKLLIASEKMKKNPDKFTEDELQNILKPYIKNYETFNVFYDTHNNASKLLTKIVLKEDNKGTGFDSPNVLALFDETTAFIGSAGRLIGKTGHYLIVTVDEKYEKVQKRNDLSEEEFEEYKRLFKLFDIDDDGILTPKEFEEIMNKTGIKYTWPLIIKFQKLLFKDPKIGVNLNEFIDAIINFGLFENDDVIRRVFDLYRDDTENDTLSLNGLKRIANDLETEPHRGDVNLLYKFAVNKNASVTYTEFRDFIKKEIKKGNIILPKKL